MDFKILVFLVLFKLATSLPDPGVNVNIQINVDGNEAPEPEPAPEPGSDGNGELPAVLSDEEFMSTFNKNYVNEEEKAERMTIYHENCKKIREHNKLYESGKIGYMLGCNQLSDLTDDEIISKYTGAIDEPDSSKRTIINYIPINIGQEPDSTNYEKLGALNPPRNQGGCGSCWTFAAVASIESHIFLKYGSRVKLSEQCLVDCSSPPNSGCNGGVEHWALEYVQNNGIALRDTYPYTARDGTCNTDAPKTSYKVTSVQSVKRYSDDELLNALVNAGPLTIAFNVTENFYSYKKGVFTDDICINSDPNDRSINHAMLLVGYGTEGGEPYWLVRNSWGETWGEKGYIKVNRKEKNHCQISCRAYFPIVEGDTTQIKCIECDGSTGQQYFQHPTDCTKFMQCTNSGPQEKSCSLGTRWNHQILACNSIALTPCSVGDYTYPDGSCVAPEK